MIWLVLGVVGALLSLTTALAVCGAFAAGWEDQ